jgi:hypothetical protein
MISVKFANRWARHRIPQARRRSIITEQLYRWLPWLTPCRPTESSLCAAARKMILDSDQWTCHLDTADIGLQLFSSGRGHDTVILTKFLLMYYKIMAHEAKKLFARYKIVD